jgi:hypothetical protein
VFVEGIAECIHRRLAFKLIGILLTFVPLAQHIDSLFGIPVVIYAYPAIECSDKIYEEG